VRSIVHLSDLHLAVSTRRSRHSCCVGAAPDIVVVSGDLTQRARIAEFKAAA
jgi:3',5'-cyclic AMP phosphodiesterase CpdA